MASMIKHLCNPAHGEQLEANRKNVLVDTGTESSLYSGRGAYVDTSDMAREHDQSESDCDTNSPLYFVNRGVDHPDVGGQSVIGSGFTGGIQGPSGYGPVSLIPLRPGLEIESSEYVGGTVSFSMGDLVTFETGSGQITRATAADNEIGQVSREEAKVNGVNVIGIEITRNTYQA